MSKKEPKIGDRVWLHIPGLATKMGEVVYVWNPGMVNVHVDEGGGFTENHTSVAVHDPDGDQPRPEGMHCILVDWDATEANEPPLAAETN